MPSTHPPHTYAPSSTLHTLFSSIKPGQAHLSNKPFHRRGPWGTGWRKRRSFVGKMAYSVTYLLWSPTTNHKFPATFRRLVCLMLWVAKQIDIPVDLAKCVLEMCPYDIASHWPSPPQLPEPPQATPAEEQATPAEEQATPAEEQAIPTEEQATPAEEQATPAEEHPTPADAWLLVDLHPTEYMDLHQAEYIPTPITPEYTEPNSPPAFDIGQWVMDPQPSLYDRRRVFETFQALCAPPAPAPAGVGNLYLDLLDGLPLPPQRTRRRQALSVGVSAADAPVAVEDAPRLGAPGHDVGAMAEHLPGAEREAACAHRRPRKRSAAEAEPSRAERDAKRPKHSRCPLQISGSAGGAAWQGSGDVCVGSDGH